MIINPQNIIEQNVLKADSISYKVQPNAIDFSLDQLFYIEPTITYLSNDKPSVVHKTHVEVQLTDAFDVRLHNNIKEADLERNQKMGWLLQPNAIYDGVSSVYVKVPEGMCALLIGRSTLNRNAVLLTSGLYDSGFEGNIGFTLHNRSGSTFIEKGTMVGQIMFIKADSAHLYSGSYNTKEGQHWAEAVAEKIAEPVKEEVVIKEEITVEPIKEEIVIEVQNEPVVEQSAIQGREPRRRR